MDYIHTQKNISHTPRKLRLLADALRAMKPEQALDWLEFSPRGASSDLSKAIKSALANAGKEGLEFKRLEINEGMSLKRFRPGTAGKGRGRPYKKRLSHIRIILTDEVSEPILKKNRHLKAAKEVVSEVVIEENVKNEKKAGSK